MNHRLLAAALRWQDVLMADRWVLVGGGVAGSVVAARLAAVGADVILLEQGVDGATPDDLHEAAQVPGRTMPGMRAQRVDDGPYVPYTSGSGLGGGSSINPGFASNAGPFHHSHQLPIEGQGRRQRVRQQGSRASVSDVYLRNSGLVDRIEVRTEATVDQVVVEDGQARGVALSEGGVIEAHQVVMCAGALVSPAMLMRSGVVSAGLGSRLQDHPSVALRYRNNEGLPSATCDVERSGAIQIMTTVVGDEIWVVPALMRPSSLGVIELDENGNADIRFQLCQAEAERALLADAVANLVAANGHRESIDAPEVDEVSDWMMHQVASVTPVYSHATGGCPMGAVTDRCGRVNDVAGLFVVDSSVFPAVPSVNPMVPTVQLAETITNRWLAEGLVAN